MAEHRLRGHRPRGMDQAVVGAIDHVVAADRRGDRRRRRRVGRGGQREPLPAPDRRGPGGDQDRIRRAVEKLQRIPDRPTRHGHRRRAVVGRRIRIAVDPGHPGRRPATPDTARRQGNGTRHRQPGRWRSDRTDVFPCRASIPRARPPGRHTRSRRRTGRHPRVRLVSGRGDADRRWTRRDDPEHRRRDRRTRGTAVDPPPAHARPAHSMEQHHRPIPRPQRGRTTRLAPPGPTRTRRATGVPDLLRLGRHRPGHRRHRDQPDATHDPRQSRRSPRSVPAVLTGG